MNKKKKSNYFWSSNSYLFLGLFNYSSWKTAKINGPTLISLENIGKINI